MRSDRIRAHAFAGAFHVTPRAYHRRMGKANAHAVWAVVVLVIGILAALVTLSMAGKDVSPVTTVVGSVVAPLLLAMVYGEIKAVREQTNGTTSKLVDAIAAAPAAPPKQDAES